MRRRASAALTIVAVAAAACTSASPLAPSAAPSVAPSVETPRSAPPEPSSTPSPPQESVAPTPIHEPSASPAEGAVPTGWTRLDAAGPGPREDHTLTVTPDGSAWLFGGRDGRTVHGDLWRLDIATDTWAEVAAAGAAPEARFGHTATWVDGVGLVVWSGQAGSTFFDDLWAWDPAAQAWRELPAPDDRPAARYGSCAALGADGKLIVSHGFTSDFGRFDDTWAYDFADGTWTDVSTDGGPFVRCLHDCLVTPDGRFLVYAGQTTGAPAIGDLWARDASGAWTEAPAPEPPPRQLYALAVRGDHAWVFGGGATDGSKLGDLWRLDVGSLGWEAIAVGGGPSARSGAALAWDQRGDRLILVGGLTAVGASAETWAVNFGD